MRSSITQPIALCMATSCRFWVILITHFVSDASYYLHKKLTLKHHDIKCCSCFWSTIYFQHSKHIVKTAQKYFHTERIFVNFPVMIWIVKRQKESPSGERRCIVDRTLKSLPSLCTRITHKTLNSCQLFNIQTPLYSYDEVGKWCECLTIDDSK